MKLIKLSFSLLVAILLNSNAVRAQLFVDAGTDFMIQGGAVVTVQGDVESKVDFLTDGDNSGLLLLKGSGVQNVNMNNFIVPNLELDNAAGANLTGSAKISRMLRFTTGKITNNTSDLTIFYNANMFGYDANKFVNTNLTGQLKKLVQAPGLTDYEMPVGQNTSYNPLLFTAVGPQPDAIVGVRDTLDVHPKKNPQATDFLKSYWKLTQAGVTTLTARGNYIDPAQVNGTDTKFAAFQWREDQQAWSNVGGVVNAGNNTTQNTIIGNGDLYAMNGFGLVRAKVLLQGAYDAVTHLMRDNLRTGGNGVNLIPSSDPYRVAPYNTAFTQINNPIAEQANPTLFTNQPLVDNDIVDWVFLQLRSGADGKTILATRSALVQRDGDVVDMDGSSPIYFKDVPEGNNYTLAVRHRNHLGISTDPVTTPVTVSVAAPALVDFTTLTDAQIFGPATAYKIAADGKNLLWGGNANFNTLVSYNGNLNDRQKILETLNFNPITILSNVYDPADITMNRFVSYNGNFNDRIFILNEVLAVNPITVRLQSLP